MPVQWFWKILACVTYNTLLFIVLSVNTHTKQISVLFKGSYIKYTHCKIYIYIYVFINLHTGHLMHQQFWHSTIVRSAHSVLMCFVFIWEQTATCDTYSINWLVFITDMKSVYCAVRTGSLNKAVCASSLKG